MGKQLARHWTRGQGSRIAVVRALNYEFAMYRKSPGREEAERRPWPDCRMDGALSVPKGPLPLASGTRLFRLAAVFEPG